MEVHFVGYINIMARIISAARKVRGRNKKKSDGTVFSSNICLCF